MITVGNFGGMHVWFSLWMAGEIFNFKRTHFKRYCLIDKNNNHMYCEINLTLIHCCEKSLDKYHCLLLDLEAEEKEMQTNH